MLYRGPLREQKHPDPSEPHLGEKQVTEAEKELQPPDFEKLQLFMNRDVGDKRRCFDLNRFISFFCGQKKQI